MAATVVCSEEVTGVSNSGSTVLYSKPTKPQALQTHQPNSEHNALDPGFHGKNVLVPPVKTLNPKP